MKHEFEMKEVVAEIIFMLMKKKTKVFFAHSHEATMNIRTLLLQEWIDYFDAMYGTVTIDFYRLVVGSKNFMEERIYSWYNPGNSTPASTPVQATSAHVVPSSPVSSVNF